MTELLRDKLVPEEDCEHDRESSHGPEEDLCAETREKKHVEPFALETFCMGDMPVMRLTLTYGGLPKGGYHYSTCVS